VHVVVHMVLCNSSTLRSAGPARRCSPSMFWVSTRTAIPGSSSRASAWCAALGWARSPLTQTTGPDNIEVDPDALPLSDGLRSDLARWRARFEATLSGWPASGGFDSEHDAELFVAAGQRLVVQLQDELGASYHVEYMPEPIRPPGVKLRTRSNH
jgi:hypothetical protein